MPSIDDEICALERDLEEARGRKRSALEAEQRQLTARLADIQNALAAAPGKSRQSALPIGRRPGTPLLRDQIVGLLRSSPNGLTQGQIWRGLRDYHYRTVGIRLRELKRSSAIVSVGRPAIYAVRGANHGPVMAARLASEADV